MNCNDPRSISPDKAFFTITASEQRIRHALECLEPEVNRNVNHLSQPQGREFLLDMAGAKTQKQRDLDAVVLDATFGLVRRSKNEQVTLNAVRESASAWIGEVYRAAASDGTIDNLQGAQIGGALLTIFRAVEQIEAREGAQKG